MNICSKGAISIAILFTKEQKRNWVERQNCTEEVTTEVGKIVTVTKYSRSKEQEDNSPIRISTHAQEERKEPTEDCLDVALQLCELVGGNLTQRTVENGREEAYQITFDVFCTFYPIQELQLKRGEDITHHVPLVRKRSISEAVAQ